MNDPTKLEVAPLRSLDDFILESARFQIPQFNDLEKWNNRIVQNLLYYQTNYFITYIAVFLLISFIHPVQMFYGILVFCSGFGAFHYVTNNKQVANDFNKRHPIASLVVVFSVSYYVVYLIGSLVVFVFGTLFPLFVILVHASLRLRNMKNKIINKVEWLGLKKTYMGTILDYLGVEQDMFM